MEILVTLDALQHREGEKVLHYPQDTLVTKEARAYAAKRGIDIFVGGEKLPKPSVENGKPGLKAVISVIGEDKVGIIAGISTVLAEAGVNILDITQTAIEGLFTMIMIVDISGAVVSFEELKQRLSAKGVGMSVRIDAQREEVFHFMHRI